LLGLFPNVSKEGPGQNTKKSSCGNKSRKDSLWRRINMVKKKYSEEYSENPPITKVLCKKITNLSNSV
jgi:hypothetical protein